MLDEIAQKIVHKDKQGDQKIKGGFSLTETARPSTGNRAFSN